VSVVSPPRPAARCVPGRVAGRAAWHAGIYYAVFFASVAWAFARGAARAAVPLLWLAAACTLAIPASSLLGWLAPATGAWSSGPMAGVDLTALVGAAVLACMARATARRIREGARDSVWALPQGVAATQA